MGLAGVEPGPCRLASDAPLGRVTAAGGEDGGLRCSCDWDPTEYPASLPALDLVRLIYPSPGPADSDSVLPARGRNTLLADVGLVRGLRFAVSSGMLTWCTTTLAGTGIARGRARSGRLSSDAWPGVCGTSIHVGLTMNGKGSERTGTRSAEALRLRRRRTRRRMMMTATSSRRAAPPRAPPSSAPRRWLPVRGARIESNDAVFAFVCGKTNTGALDRRVGDVVSGSAWRLRLEEPEPAWTGGTGGGGSWLGIAMMTPNERRWLARAADGTEDLELRGQTRTRTQVSVSHRRSYIHSGRSNAATTHLITDSALASFLPSPPAGQGHGHAWASVACTTATRGKAGALAKAGESVVSEREWRSEER
ncbi:hypothetical protein C8F01DRAFT_1126640 [Mycena amicta]|nr:hypothetical protein C8F01DRAFT_1126640 [Mycena amicta]